MKKRRPIYETPAIQYDVFGNFLKHGKVSYKIDPLNRRLSRTVDGVLTNMYAYNPEGQMIAELDQNGRLLKYFIYGSRKHVPDYFVDTNNERFKIITDHLGSVRYVVNSSTGEVKLKMNHDEFGKVLVDTNPNYLPFGFAGGTYDFKTGLVRFGARDYDSLTGRWTSKDPIGFSGGDTNLYGYVLQNPINWTDANGLYASLPGEGGNSPGYIDVNLTIGLGPVVTGGVQIGSGSTCFYVGGGAGTPGIGVSFQPGAPSYSDSVCGSISNGISIGASVGSEISPSVGVSGPGLSLTYQRTLICF